MKRRWYDNNDNIIQALDILENLPSALRENLAVNIINFANLLRKNYEEIEEEQQLSIGKNRVLGLYKSFKKRRWYDKNPSLMSAMNILATLPSEDFEKIAEGTVLTLNNIRNN